MFVKKKRAVFFDRDGVILKAVVEDGTPRPPYSIAEYREKSGRMPSAREAVEEVRRLGFLAILASNQPDIRYGKISKEEWQWIQDQIKDIPFDDIFICFHGREDICECKKPKPGMLLEAAKKWNIALPESFLVGDTADDVIAAARAGSRSILFRAEYNASVGADYKISELSKLPGTIS
ncbi:MAG: phosphatase [Parcubacteria group bacterium Greene0416_79]|nr:MAG: phosphatase [Parcubacteria group bacterium Greene0416_79]